MRTVLSIDPGEEGGAFLLGRNEDETDVLVLGAVAWRRKGADRHAISWVDRRTRTLRRSTVTTLAQVGALAIPAALEVGPSSRPDAIAIEDAFVGVNPRTALRVARDGGRLEAALEGACWPGRPPTVRFLDPNAWWRALGLRAARERDERKAISVKEVPNLLPGLAEVFVLLGRSHHLSDAAAIGLTAIRHDAWDDLSDQAWAARVGEAGTRPRSARRASVEP